MTIRWFPGHMGKALEQIEEQIRRIDVVIEVLDARLPFSSSNHKLAALRNNKVWIKVLNKYDLADPAVTKAWVKNYQLQAGVRALPMSARKHADTKLLIKLCKELVPRRGQPGFPVRAMVVGIPNVGKSTLINTLAGRKVATVGDRPAITKATQQIDLRNGIVLSDTPGMLWPDMKDQDGAYRLAATGAIGDNALDYTSVGLFAGEYLLRRYPELVRERYGLQDLPETAHDLMMAVGLKRGLLAPGGIIDLHKASEAFLRELRAGKIGRISMEEPESQSSVNE